MTDLSLEERNKPNISIRSSVFINSDFNLMRAMGKKSKSIKYLPLQFYDIL